MLQFVTIKTAVIEAELLIVFIWTRQPALQYQHGENVLVLENLGRTFYLS